MNKVDEIMKSMGNYIDLIALYEVDKPLTQPSSPAAESRPSAARG